MGIPQRPKGWFCSSGDPDPQWGSKIQQDMRHCLPTPNDEDHKRTAMSFTLTALTYMHPAFNPITYFADEHFKLHF